MSDRDRPEAHRPDADGPEADRTEEPESPSQGPNLVLLYSLIALAILAATGLALLAVLPFYHRR